MRDEQAWWIVLSFAILAVVSLLAHFRRLPANRIASFLIVFPAGVGIIASLWMAGIPPRWFDGSTSNFILGATFVLTAFLGRAVREFRLPLLLGIGSALLVFNFVAHL